MIDQRIPESVGDVLAFMRKRGLKLDDLLSYGGEDLRPGGTRREKARRVEACWSLMARLGVKYADKQLATCLDSTARRITVGGIDAAASGQ